MAGLVVLCTVPDLKTARRLAKSLLRKRLAACISMKGGFLSSYWWKGRFETSSEVLLFIKTTERKFSQIEKWIRATHPYELPEVIALPIVKGSADYLSWLRQVLKK